MISTCVMLTALEVTPSSGLWALQAQQERWLSSQAAFGHLWAPHVLSEEVRRWLLCVLVLSSSQQVGESWDFQAGITGK